MWRCTCALALFCATLVDAEAFKRADMSASPFVLISRYGRSSPRMMTSRIDKFFLSRYGKRSDPLTRAYDITENIQNERERVQDRGREGDRDILQKWRPRCDCASYIKRLALKNYNKRTPETIDPTVYED
ncbi:uncharacterized protein LOC126778997 [Nymphalis io]|uniref:uncharacterized protein LOC126778997 n=1 Tax=Inachis io TaxID=171585 RepID=UPI002169A061|nr:uncharacterized protein LOC126778997 [Nymphalis io]XP_050358706.1 uncharacterized protein LOC126778997 [Nymphalis io]